MSRSRDLAATRRASRAYRPTVELLSGGRDILVPVPVLVPEVVVVAANPYGPRLVRAWRTISSTPKNQKEWRNIPYLFGLVYSIPSCKLVREASLGAISWRAHGSMVSRHDGIADCQRTWRAACMVGGHVEAGKATAWLSRPRRLVLSYVSRKSRSVRVAVPKGDWATWICSKDGRLDVRFHSPCALLIPGSLPERLAIKMGTLFPDCCTIPAGHALSSTLSWTTNHRSEQQF
ncbi:hypothetical protein F4780DRAFT_107362 [Xylariomycetidae sp. FL0641]|nr:hypothetical protein F4780DRAFT_107362 [Xylariomycetidae sp. FL0641]